MCMFHILYNVTNTKSTHANVDDPQKRIDMIILTIGDRSSKVKEWHRIVYRDQTWFFMH